MFHFHSSNCLARGRSTHERCTGRIASNNGKIHFFLSSDFVRFIHIPSNACNSKSMSANSCPGSDGCSNCARTTGRFNILNITLLNALLTPLFLNILQTVSKKEGINLPLELADRIANACRGNLRRAILMLEACRAERYPFGDNQQLVEPDYEKYLKDTAMMIVQEQSPERLLAVRENVYELLSHCIPTDLIFKGLLKELVRNCDNQLKAEICSEAARCQWRATKGNKAIFHIEEFVAKFMSIYKRFIEQAAMIDDDMLE